MKSEALGVGALIGETFRIFFGQYSIILILAFLPLLASNAIREAFLDPPALDQAESEDASAATFTRAAPVTEAHPVGLADQARSLVFMSFAIGLVVAAAHDAKRGGAVRPAACVRAAVSRLIPIMAVGITVCFAVAIGMVLLVIPGLWVMAGFSCAVTAVVVERRGFGAFGRSWDLTSGYCLPILGTFAILFFCFFALAAPLRLLILPEIYSLTGSPWLMVVLNSMVGAVGTGTLTVGCVLIHARLCEIKEGGSADQIAEVFG